MNDCQTSKSEKLLLACLSYKEILKLFRQKENEDKWKLGSTERNGVPKMTNKWVNIKDLLAHLLNLLDNWF